MKDRTGGVPGCARLRVADAERVEEQYQRSFTNPESAEGDRQYLQHEHRIVGLVLLLSLALRLLCVLE